MVMLVRVVDFQSHHTNPTVHYRLGIFHINAVVCATRAIL